MPAVIRLALENDGKPHFWLYSERSEDYNEITGANKQADHIG